MVTQVQSITLTITFSIFHTMAFLLWVGHLIIICLNRDQNKLQNTVVYLGS